MKLKLRLFLRNLRLFLNSRRRWLTPWLAFGLFQGTVNLVVSAVAGLPVLATIGCALMLGVAVVLVICSWQNYRLQVEYARLRSRYRRDIRFEKRAARAVLENTFKRFNAEQDEVVLMVFGGQNDRRAGMN